jgi:hypothetical protein
MEKHQTNKRESERTPDNKNTMDLNDIKMTE